MAIAREQYKYSYVDSTTTQNVTFDSNVTAGSLLILVVSAWHYGDAQITNVADNNGNSWNEIYYTNYDGFDNAGLWYAYNANSGSTTVTITFNNTGMYSSAVIVEVSGIDTTSPLDQNNENTSSASSWDSGNITTTQADEYLIGAMAIDNGNRALTEDGAWTLIYEEENGNSYMPISVGERIVSSTLTESYSGTIDSPSSGHWAAIASFKAAGGGGGGISVPVAMRHFRNLRT